MKKNMLVLKGKIVENNMTMDGIAKKMGIVRSTFYRKMMTGGNEFTAGEIKLIQEILGLANEQVHTIFLT